MRLVVDASGHATLRDASDLKRFKLVLEDAAMSAQALAEALRGLGTLGDGETVWIDPARLRRLGDQADDLAWQRDFDAMVAAAVRHGWVDSVSSAVRVHVER
jgi:hypothetical protein